MSRDPDVTRVQRALDGESGRTGIVVQRDGCNRVWVENMDLPTGTIPAELMLRKLRAGWEMSGRFGSDPPKADVCGRFGEYRQWVKGRFTRNGQLAPKTLPDGKLEPDRFREDGDTQGLKYGYHGIKFSGSKFTRPDQATGQTWKGQDDPGMVAKDPGDTLGVELDFRGEFIDTRHPATPLRESTWRVAGEATYPGSPAPPPASGPVGSGRESPGDRGSVITASSDPVLTE
jgi:hypothetical protein